MLLEVHGVELPGLRFERFVGVRVGLRLGDDVVDLVAGDAREAWWRTKLRVRELDDRFDYTGPAVRGRRGERTLALAWLDDTGEMFRAAKLRLELLPAKTVANALAARVSVVMTVGLTDDRGGPLCATVPESRVSCRLGG